MLYFILKVLNIFKKVKKTKFPRLEGINIINIDGNIQRFNKILKALNLLPDTILNIMKENELTIHYSKNSEPVEFGEYSGFYDRSENYIYLWDNGPLRTDWQQITVVHEIGHFIDFKLGFSNYISCIDSNFHNICLDESIYYNKYSEGNYYQYNIIEYFAQSFAEYFLVKNFEDYCPNTAMYIKYQLQLLN